MEQAADHGSRYGAAGEPFSCHGVAWRGGAGQTPLMVGFTGVYGRPAGRLLGRRIVRSFHRSSYTPLLLATVLLSGCVIMVPGHLYPVQGPLAAANPPPIYSLTMNGIYKSGTLTATLPDGEKCSGNWSAISANDPNARQMSAAWDSIYGPGFFVAHVLGNPVFAGAVLTGDRGTTLEVQFVDPRPGDVAAVEGVASDKSGNLFKLTME